MTVLGRQMSQEMNEQPDALSRIAGRFDTIVEELRRRDAESCRGLAVLARGGLMQGEVTLIMDMSSRPRA